LDEFWDICYLIVFREVLFRSYLREEHFGKIYGSTVGTIYTNSKSILLISLSLGFVHVGLHTAKKYNLTLIYCF